MFVETEHLRKQNAYEEVWALTNNEKRSTNKDFTQLFI